MRQMAKLPEGRKALPDEWFIDRAKIMQPEPKEEKKLKNSCLQCDGPAEYYLCNFCLEDK